MFNGEFTTPLFYLSESLVLLDKDLPLTLAPFDPASDPQEMAKQPYNFIHVPTLEYKLSSLHFQSFANSSKLKLVRSDRSFVP